MTDAGSLLSELDDFEKSLTEYVKAAARKHPAEASFLFEMLAEWLGPIARTKDFLLKHPAPRPRGDPHVS